MGNFASSNQPVAIQSLELQNIISNTKFTVYRAYSPSRKTHYALKVFPKDTYGAIQYHRESLMSNFSHPNIVRYIPALQSQKTNFNGILTEYSKYQDMFDLVVGSVLNSEILIRTYFHQLIAGLEYIHSHGIAHLDLKLENLLMGSDFNLKIIDFEQAQSVNDKALLFKGTLGFRAPEVIYGVCKNFKAADIYSAAIILYAFKSQDSIFTETETYMTEKASWKVPALCEYAKFVKDNKGFWEKKTAEKRDATFFSRDFKDLMNGMLEYDVRRRYTLQEIKNSRWFNGPVLDKQSLKTIMEKNLSNFTKKK